MDTILICGLRKSGTSMFKNLMDGSPNALVCPMNELHIFSRICEYPILMPMKYGKNARAMRDNLSLACEDISKDTFLLRLANEEATDYFDFSGDYVKEVVKRLRKMRPADLNELFELLPQAFNVGGRSEISKFVFKQVLSEECVESLFSRLPDSKSLYVLRNPYAHVVSVRKAMQANWYRRENGIELTRHVSEDEVEGSPFPDLLAEVYRMSISYKLMLRLSELFPNRFKVVVYDRLLEDPEREMQAVCDFAGVDFCKENLITSVLGHPIKMRGRTAGDHSVGISKGPILGWKKFITDFEARCIQKYFATIIELFEFEGVEEVKGSFRGSLANPTAGNESLINGASVLRV